MNIPTCSTQPQDHNHIFRKIFLRHTRFHAPAKARPHAPATRRHVRRTRTASTDAVRNIPLSLTDSINGVRNIPSDLTEYSVTFSGDVAGAGKLEKLQTLFSHSFLNHFS